MTKQQLIDLLIAGFESSRYEDRLIDPEYRDILSPAIAAFAWVEIDVDDPGFIVPNMEQTVRELSMVIDAVTYARSQIQHDLLPKAKAGQSGGA